MIIQVNSVCVERLNKTLFSFSFLDQKKKLKKVKKKNIMLKDVIEIKK